MSKKQKRIVRFSLVLPLILGLCFVLCMQQTSAIADQELTDDVKKKEYRKTFDAYLGTLYGHLQDAYDLGRFESRESIRFVERVVVFSPQGERFAGKNGLEKFFKELKKIGVTEIEFTTLDKEVLLVKDPQGTGDDTIDAIGFGTFTYKLFTDANGDNGKDEDGGGGTDGRHPRSCVWEP